MNFCPKCGTRCDPEWLFCAQCGAPVAAEVQRSGGLPVRPVAAFAVFCLLAIVGVGTWVRILGTKPPAGPAGSLATTSPMAQNLGPGGPGLPLPEGHPPVGRFELPEETRTFIAGLAAEAAKRPRDTAAWERLAEVQRRAARVDRSYYLEAVNSYRHVLELSPESTKALRGLASVHYDLGEYNKARPYLEKYLSLMPDDHAAQTDLATVRLRSGDPEQAIAIYREVIAEHPLFFQAHINLAAALHQTGHDGEAREVLRRTKEAAKDEPTRTEIDRLMAKLDERPN